jgi:hypothetical protein
MNRHTTTMQASHGKPPASLPDRFARTFDVNRERRVTLFSLKNIVMLATPTKQKRPPTEAGGHRKQDRANYF